jgi:hypothetical protein
VTVSLKPDGDGTWLTRQYEHLFDQAPAMATRGLEWSARHVRNLCRLNLATISNAEEPIMQTHTAVFREQWIAAREALLAREKDLTRARDRLSAGRCLGSGSTSPTGSTGRRAARGAEAWRVAIGISLVQSGCSPRGVLSPGGDCSERSPAQRCARGRSISPRYRAERRQHRNGDYCPDAFTDDQWQGARARLQAQGFKILLGPDATFDTTSTLMSGKADPAFFDSLAENITPSTDDNPFFFYTARLAACRT